MIARPPWHAGERALHQHLGVAARIQDVGARVIRDAMPDQHRAFFAQLPFILAGFADEAGRVWASLLAGPPGFVSSPDPRQLTIATMPALGDPFAKAVRPGLGLGLLGIELPTRRRNRANGRVARVDESGISLAVEESFGNCPKYIERRDYLTAQPARQVMAEPLRGLDASARRLIGSAVTFFVASTAGPQTLPDISHRGGRPGFVTLSEDGTLAVPDYTGNFFFNTLGNFLLDPRAGLLFPDFSSGDLLQLTGMAKLVPETVAMPEMPGAERVWEFRAQRGQWLRGALPVCFGPGEPSTFSP